MLLILNRVVRLIDEGQLNLDLSNSLFKPSSVHAIQTISLPQAYVSDRFVWSYCRDGIYTAASGYGLSKTLAFQKERQKFGAEIHDERLWERLWNLQVQPKLRFFLWKIIHGIFPIADALHAHDMDVSLSCPICNQANETISHFLFTCPVARQFGNHGGV
ncbi:hypothetical protein LINGRAHAP2_LOCUS23282 [Linum grandiflorum]